MKIYNRVIAGQKRIHAEQGLLESRRISQGVFRENRGTLRKSGTTDFTESTDNNYELMELVDD